MEISLEEDMNTPPRIMVRDPETDKKALLLDLNPQFAALTLASVEEIHWNALDGHEGREVDCTCRLLTCPGGGIRGDSDARIQS